MENKKMLEALTVITESNNQNDCLSKILKPMFEAFSYYKKGKVEAFPLVSRGQIIFQMYPKFSTIMFGQNQPLNEVLPNE